jgi:hypothetical protein
MSVEAAISVLRPSGATDSRLEEKHARLTAVSPMDFRQRIPLRTPLRPEGRQLTCELYQA